MAKKTVKFKISLPVFDGFKQSVDLQLGRSIGTRAVGVAKKDFILAGKSPVEGFGRFEGYIAQRATAKASKIASRLTGARRKKVRSKIRDSRAGLYPISVRDKFPGKKLRPVNLRLDGSFLKHFTWWMKRTGALGLFGNKLIVIGMSAGRGRFSKPKKLILDMFETHNDGTHKHVPMRKFLPNKRGDKFKRQITLNIKDIYEKRIQQIIKKFNPK